MDTLCVLIGALAVLAIPVILVVWLVESVRRQPRQRYQRTQYKRAGRDHDPLAEFANEFFGQDEVRRMDEQYGPEYKMALLDEMMWEDIEQH